MLTPTRSSTRRHSRRCLAWAASAAGPREGLICSPARRPRPRRPARRLRRAPAASPLCSQEAPQCPMMLRCDVDAGTCVACAVSSDCPMKQVCRTSDGACVACLSTSDCGPGQRATEPTAACPIAARPASTTTPRLRRRTEREGRAWSRGAPVTPSVLMAFAHSVRRVFWLVAPLAAGACSAKSSRFASDPTSDGLTDGGGAANFSAADGAFASPNRCAMPG